MTEYHPLTGEPSNAQRAEWALVGVDAFAVETYGGRTFTATVVEQPEDDGDAYTMIQDLICDALHLAAAHGWDALDMLRRARCNFEQEVTQELEP